MLSKERTISSFWPPMEMSKPSGRAIPAASASISSTALPRSRPARLAVITTTRSWSRRRISAGPSTTSSSATDSRETGTG